jgi:hypothetical protein
MMHLFRRTSLLGAFYLLTSAATAHAECAWVLWGNVEKGGHFTDGSKWKALVAHRTQVACEQDRDGEQAKRRALEDTFLKATGGTDVILFRCLPDTVDPRGPKGDGR